MSLRLQSLKKLMNNKGEFTTQKLGHNSKLIYENHYEKNRVISSIGKVKHFLGDLIRCKQFETTLVVSPLTREHDCVM